MNKELLVGRIPLILLAFILNLLSPGRASAGGTVTVMDEAHLRAALTGGGMVTFAADGTIILGATLTISNSTTIDGTGHTVTLDGGNAVRVLTVTNPITLSLINLTIAHGLAAGTNGAPEVAGGIGQGGGIYMKGGTLMISNCQFLANAVRGGDGGDGVGFSLSGGTGGKGLGGAIDLSGGILLATNCQFFGNSAMGGNGGGGSIYLGTGFGGDGLGGAIHASTNTALIVDCIFRTNEVHGGGQTANAVDGSSQAGGALGGGIALEGGSLTNVNCQFIGNSGSTARFGSQYDPTSGSASRGGAVFNAGGDVTVSGATFISNSVTGGHSTYYNARGGTGQGGAIYNGGQLSSSACVFGFNSASGGTLGQPPGDGQGGAIFNAGSASLNQSILSSNLVQGAQSGFIQNAYWGGTGNSKGGGLYNAGSIEVTGCTFSGNEAIGVAAMNSQLGDGIASEPGISYGGAVFNSGTLTVTNSTLHTNLALGGPTVTNGTSVGGYYHLHTGADAFGAGIYNTTGTVVSVNNTFALNDAEGGTGPTNGTGFGGGIYSTNGGATLINTILTNGVSSSNYFGVLIDGGHNMSSDGSCNFTNTGSLNNTDPLIGPLQDNGGPTPTMALLPGSPAIDAGDTAAAPWLDQRGIARPVGPAPDIGAFEYYDTNTPPACFYRLSSTNASFGMTGGSGTVGVVASYYCDWTAGSDSAWLAITSATNATGSQTLTYFVATNNSTAVPRTGTLTIAGQIFTVTQLGTDVTLPSVTITAPVANSKQTNAVVTVQGTAKDNIGLAAVEYRLENANGVGAYQTATGTTNWSANVTALAPGGNTVRVRARDLNNNLSSEVTRTFLSVQMEPLMVTINGAGTVSPNLNGQMLQLGNSYTMTAKPAVGNVFSNWTGSVTSSVAKLTFVMWSNTVLNATFTTNVFIPVQGTYNGLALDRTNLMHGRSGYFSLKLTTEQMVSGQFIISNVTYSVKAQVLPNGQVQIPLMRGNPKQQVMTAELQFDLSNGTGQVNGTLSNARTVNGVAQPATWVSEVSGDRAGYFTSANPAPQVGAYTLLFPGGNGTNEPAGYGFAMVKVDGLGNVQMSGMLADGTAMAQHVGISKDGRWPLFVKLSQAGNASVLGWLNFTNQTGSDISGQVEWTKLANPYAVYYPSGFVETMAAEGSRYAAPAGTNGIVNFSSGFLQFSSGSLATPFTNGITLGVDGKVTNTSPNALSASINKTTGVFSGKVTVPGTSTVLPFKGAVLQSQDFGYGYFLNAGRSGLVLLTQ